MSTQLYWGFNSEGRRISGSKNFASEDQLKDYLQKREITNYQILESKTTYRSGAYSLVSPKELSIFCKQMSVLFFSHITLMEGVQVLAEQTDNAQLKLALGEVYDFMEKGYTFAEAIGMYEHIFTTYLLNMIVIGETSGSLDTVFLRMSAYFDKEHKIHRKLRSAITYPAVLTALMAAIVALLVVKILPMFRDILESMGAQIPSAALVILNAGTFLSSYAIPIILVIVVIILAVVFYIRTEKGRLQLDKAKFSIPAYRYINSRVITSRFARSLSILLKSGVQLLNALEDVSILMDNKFLEEKLALVVDKVRQGESPAELLGELGIFPVLFLKMFIIGEKTGNLDEMLEKSADVFDDEADDAIERFTAMLEPALITVLSIVIGVILLSVMLPMITIMNAIG